jgi:hypothetical protein
MRYYHHVTYTLEQTLITAMSRKRKPNVRDHLRDLCVTYIGFRWPGIGSHGMLNFIKCAEFLEQLNTSFGPWNRSVLHASIITGSYMVRDT